MKLEISGAEGMFSTLYDADDIPSRRSIGVIYNPDTAKFVKRACNAHKGLVEALELSKLAIEAHIEYCQGRDDYELFTAACFSLDRINFELGRAKGEL